MTDWKPARPVRIIQVDEWKTVAIARSVTEAAELLNETSLNISHICMGISGYSLIDPCFTVQYAEDPNKFQRKTYYFLKKKIMAMDFSERCDDNT